MKWTDNRLHTDARHLLAFLDEQPQGERLKRLNQIAIRQMQTLTAAPALRQLDPPKDRRQ